MARFPLRPASPNPRIRIDEDNTLAVYGDLQYMYDYMIQQQNADYKFYEIDIDATTVVDITTGKGIIEINNMATVAYPTPGAALPVFITLTNPDLPINDPHTVYLQLTPYYNPGIDDTVVPHVVVRGAISGSVISIYNVSNEAEGADQWTGLFYIYYEIKKIG